MSKGTYGNEVPLIRNSVRNISYLEKERKHKETCWDVAYFLSLG